MKRKSSAFTIPGRLPYMQREYNAITPADWVSVIQMHTRDARKAVRKSGVENSWDLTDAIIRRREKAILATIGQILDSFCGDEDPASEFRQEIAEDWIRANVLPVTTYNIIEEQSHILTGAAIWVLDQITAQPDWRKKLFPLLPTDDNVLLNIDIPDIWHCRYEYDLILSVVYVLANRNADVAPAEADQGSLPRYLTSTLTAENKHHADVPSRRAFEGIMAMVPSEAIQEAIAKYATLFASWTNRLLRGCAKMSAYALDSIRKLNETADEFNRLRDELQEKLKAAEDAQKRKQQQLKKSTPVYNPLLVNPVSTPTADPDAFLKAQRLSPQNIRGFRETPMQHIDGDPSMQDLIRITRQMDHLNKQYDAYDEEYASLTKEKTKYIIHTLRRGYLPENEQANDFHGLLADLDLKPLQISDPYELCFALLWLIETGSQLPWLYGTGTGFMAEVVESLPWGVIEYDEEDDSVWFGDEAEDEKQLSFLEDHPTKKPGKVSPVPDWYERRYGKNKDDAFDFSRSLAQILYEETGCILPRDLHRYDKRMRELSDYGVKGKDSLLMLHLYSALGEARRQIHANNLNRELMADWDSISSDEADEEPETDQPQKLSYEELEEQLRKAKEDNKRIREALHDAEKTNRDTHKRLTSVQESAQMEHRELADLRELVFRQQNETEDENAPVDGSLFPYEVRQDTVVFGGHETWLKAIQNLLKGNIRFIDKDLVFDVNIIRNADIIWIQNNAMSHKQFYRIIDTARQYRKPVRYFTWASAAKGAVQVMENDSAGK